MMRKVARVTPWTAAKMGGAVMSKVEGRTRKRGKTPWEKQVQAGAQYH